MTDQTDMGFEPEPTIGDCIDELQREIRMRERVYPRQIDKKRLTKRRADFRIRCLERSIEHLETLRSPDGAVEGTS